MDIASLPRHYYSRAVIIHSPFYALHFLFMFSCRSFVYLCSRYLYTALVLQTVCIFFKFSLPTVTLIGESTNGLDIINKDNSLDTISAANSEFRISLVGLHYAGLVKANFNIIKALFVDPILFPLSRSNAYSIHF